VPDRIAVRSCESDEKPKIILVLASIYGPTFDPQSGKLAVLLDL